MTTDIRNFAEAVDDALDAFETAATAYIAEAHRLNAEWMKSQSAPTQGIAHPHPVWEHAPDHVRAAVGGRTDLARVLGVSFTRCRTVREQYR